MAYRMLKIILCITGGLLFSGNAMSQARVGDWEFRTASPGTENAERVASTRAHSHPAGDPAPKLVIRRMKSDSPVELLITGTHDIEKDKCSYRDWKITIDTTDVPVLGYTFAPAKTELKAKLGVPGKELWDLFKMGLKLAVQVEKKCDGYSAEPGTVDYSFSLRGSHAAYKLVLGGVE